MEKGGNAENCSHSSHAFVLTNCSHYFSALLHGDTTLFKQFLKSNAKFKEYLPQLREETKKLCIQSALIPKAEDPYNKYMIGGTAAPTEVEETILNALESGIDLGSKYADSLGFVGAETYSTDNAASSDVASTSYDDSELLELFEGEESCSPKKKKKKRKKKKKKKPNKD